jgi:hypothetical protein
MNNRAIFDNRCFHVAMAEQPLDRVDVVVRQQQMARETVANVCGETRFGMPI